MFFIFRVNCIGGHRLTFVFAEQHCFELCPFKMHVSKVVTNFAMATILMENNGACCPR